MFQVLLLIMSVKHVRAVVTEEHFIDAVQVHQAMCLTPNSFCWVNERPETDLRLPREAPVQRRWVNERPEMDLRLPREAAVQRRCCGSCQCWESCYSHGSCCLGLYPNFVAAYENTNTR